MDENDKKAAELAEMVRQIREQVLQNYPTEGAGGLRLPDLMPAVYARDAAEGKVAAIGTINPRPPGLLNDLAQGAKKLVARSLDWHVREQVEFNRAVLRCLDTLIEAHNETNRALSIMANRVSAAEQTGADIKDWKEKQVANEVRFLRGVSEVKQAFEQRAASLESNVSQTIPELRSTLLDAQRRELDAALKSQHEAFTAALGRVSEAFTASLARAGEEIQQRLWKDLDKVQMDQQSMIHHELRLIRQRSNVAVPPVTASTAPLDSAPKLDWMLFAQKFRGPEEAIKRSFERYVERFAGSRDVLDLGCGRGEFLELMRQAGIPARGIDLSAESVALCLHKGLDVEQADMFRHLADLPDHSLGGIFCAQVIEHLPAAQIPELVRLCAQKLRRGAPIVFETPNPECLAIFATHFYIDPTHVRPVPPVLLVFYLEEAGFAQVEVQRFAPASESMPSVDQLPNEFRDKFFGFLDYAVVARSVA